MCSYVFPLAKPYESVRLHPRRPESRTDAKRPAGRESGLGYPKADDPAGGVPGEFGVLPGFVLQVMLHELLAYLFLAMATLVLFSGWNERNDNIR
jgi:hypothetical protein